MPDAACHPRPPLTALPRLIATDLDGTLLRDDKTVSTRTIAALAAAEEAGIEVIFVTGRPARWMGVVSDHVHGHGLAICGNGAAVVDLRRDNELVQVRPLTPAAGLAIVDELRRAAPGVSFAVERTEGMGYEPEYPTLHGDPPPSPEGLGGGTSRAPKARGSTSNRRAGRRSPTEIGPVERLLTAPRNPDQPVLKLLAHHGLLDPDGFLALARGVGGEHGEFTRSSPTALLEISGPGVSKASTLAQRCARHGIRPDQVVAIGDMPNDLEMLGWAGTAYAMGNAHPEVLAATPRHTASNEDDGVALVIEQLLSTAAGHR
ncbi:HAD hydrolase family protein [Streptomyces sp. B6B3]|uniref:HAD family hydrolase n=1 Tax=Streptomyces sp. B6B3 TaxID=3153570 RepID=UPI00325DFE04